MAKAASKVVDQVEARIKAEWLTCDLGLKMGFVAIENGHWIGKILISQWIRGTLFSDKPIYIRWRLWGSLSFFQADFRIENLQGASDIFLVEVLYGAGPKDNAEHVACFDVIY